MRRRLIIWLTVLVSVLAVALPAYLVTATPRDAEGEHEPIVYRGTTACGVERWWVKTGIDGDARKVNTRTVVSTNIGHLRSLSPPADLPSRSRIAPVETTVFTVTAKLLRVKQETDSDYHLVIADTGGRTMIAEIPSPA